MIGTENDGLEIYCRKLGHYLHFKYCREENLSLPCSKIKECWHSTIDVNEYLAQNYSDEEIKSIDRPPVAKISTIVDLITRVTKDTE